MNYDRNPLDMGRDSSDAYNRNLQDAAKSIHQLCIEHENEEQTLKISNASRLYKTTKAQMAELDKFSRKVASEANNYQTQLIIKYFDKYGKKLETSAKLQRELQDKVIAYGKAVGEKIRAEEFQQELNDVYFIKNAKQKADLDIANAQVQQTKNQKQLDFDVLNQQKQATVDLYNQEIQLNTNQSKIDSDTRILLAKQASEQLGYTDVELHQARLNMYTNELQTKLGIIENERKQDLSGVQQTHKAKLQSYVELATAQAAVTAAAASGDQDALKAAEQHLADVQAEYDLKKKQYSDAKKQYKENKKQRKEQIKDAQKETANRMREEGATELEVMTATKKFSLAGIKEAAFSKAFSKETASLIANKFVNGMKEAFESTIQTYGSYQSKINTRLQGSGKQWEGSSGIEERMKNSIGSNPYIKLQTVMDNVVKATESGIAYNIEQRAFLQTVSENIASTFDAFNSNLLRTIRLQQADTTAARLGLEANLTSLFNSLYQDTSYLSDSFDTVSGNLTEAISQMTAEEGVAFEYTVQKWLGSLSSVGFSSDAVNKISQALNYLGSGDISSLSSNSEMQNLIVMAASRAGMSYSDMLIDGIDSSETNKLMKSMVEYLQEIANSDNKVVKSQYASIFGMSVADLKAVNNLSSTIETISDTALSYSGAMNELYSQMGQLDSRISLAGKLNNMLDNVKYSIGTSIASNPATYALWEITSMIEDLTGGINLPTISAFGNSVDLNTTVTNLMRLPIVGVSTLSSMGTIVNGIINTFAPSRILSSLGIENSSEADKTSLYNTVKSRGSGLSRTATTLNQQSSSTYVGNSSGDDYYQATLTSAKEQTEVETAKAKEESTDKTTNDIYDYLVTVFDPKFTEVEKLMALMSGYQTKEDTITDFKSLSNKEQYATSISIKYPDQDVQKSVNVTTLLTNINTGINDLKTIVSNLNEKIPNYSLGFSDNSI